MHTIGFLGCGNMGNALIKAMHNSGNTNAKLYLYDVETERANTLAAEVNGSACKSELDLFQNAQIIVLAVKPTVIPSLLNKELVKAAKGRLIISIAAGITLTTLGQLLPESRIIRVMPNTPSMCGAGVIAYSEQESCTAQDSDAFTQIFTHAGKLFPVEEKLMDAVTGLSGSGPAYVFAAINALAEGGVKEGLPKQIALPMAAQTFLGAAKLLQESGEHPELLKDRVTSPGGTTAAGLAVLEKRGLRSALIEAVGAATKRAKELGA